MLMDFSYFLPLYPHRHHKTNVTSSDVFRVVRIHILFLKSNDKNEVERRSMSNSSFCDSLFFKASLIFKFIFKWPIL